MLKILMYYKNIRKEEAYELFKREYVTYDNLISLLKFGLTVI